MRDDGGMVDQIFVDHKGFWGMKDIETSYGRRWLKGTWPASITLGKKTSGFGRIWTVCNLTSVLWGCFRPLLPICSV